MKYYLYRERTIERSQDGVMYFGWGDLCWYETIKSPPRFYRVVPDTAALLMRATL